MRKNSFIYGTMVLIIVNFIVRFLGFAYKIILSRMIGPRGIGLFHLVFPILMTFVTFTTAGIPVAVSKLVAHYHSMGKNNLCKKVVFIASFLGLLISTTLSILLFIYVEPISLDILKNQHIRPCIFALIPALTFITLSSILRGYYYGMKLVHPPAIAQILEQVFRITFVLGTLYFLHPKDPQFGAIIAVIGISIGECIGLLWLLFHLHFSKIPPILNLYSLLKDSSILKKIMLISIPITLTRLVGVSMQSINAVLIPQRLLVAGYTQKQAIAVFGKLIGMAMPLLYLPFIVTSALVVNIIPSISQEMVLNQFKSIRLKSSLSIRVTLLIAIPTTMIFMFFSKPICHLFYHQPKVDEYLSFLAPVTLFLCLHQTVSGILHGMGKQLITTIHHLFGMVIQLFCTYYLVANKTLAENGYMFGFIVSMMLICLLNIRSLHAFIHLNIHIIHHILKPILASCVMIVSMLILYAFCIHTHFNILISTFISMMLGGILYIVLILLLGCIKIKTIRFLFNKK